ncbi:glycoside hydrolase family 92 protein [Maribellus comscasis]|uniref:Glycoside hydrolase family 92 protein n=1 Tax=Maribellus comscasis TaxID=2681766 RepID=A0A6I6JSM6_9BACT|nr:GH92 family glycosyl hydrolase [Maribellus comscasis]QGY42793.1 glycoside hydrolase family 92 protein [Maribellus comscasis]
MKRYCIILLTTLALISCNSCRPSMRENNKFVNPFIGTAGDYGQTDPSANIPFGMIKAGPDTDPGNHCGYDYNATKFLGFSQNRASGVGCSGTGGNLRIFPFINNLKESAEMDKNTEKAEPGFYSVKLRNGIIAEATAARTAGIYRFIFPKTEKTGFRIHFETSYSGFIDEKHIFQNDRFLKGWIQCRGNCKMGSYKFYYFVELAEKPAEIKESKGIADIYFSANSSQTQIIKVGLSSVSTAEAEKNLNSEAAEINFDQMRAIAAKNWREYLGRVNVTTDNDTLKTLFYTHLYHASQTPYNIIDESGSYGGSDGNTYHSDNGSYYSGWSLWDTFRSKMPLLSILYPEKYKNMMHSMYQLYKQGKSDDPTDTESFILIRNEHSIPVLLDAYRKDLLDEPLADVLHLMKKEAESLSVDSPDKILEACYDWWAFSEIAGKLGDVALQKEFYEKAINYRNIWDDKFKVMGANADVMHGDGLYEGTLWQYRWFVPYDYPWIEDAMGGKKASVSQLDYFFENNLFNVGNQPDIHVPFLYYEFGEPWKSQKLVRQILLEPTVNHYGTHEKWKNPYIGKVFKAEPEGYIEEMDDDAGTMSAWFVLSSMGLYPRNIGETSYWILPSVFEEVSIRLADKKSFKIINRRNSSDDIYIESATLNGEPFLKSWIDYRDIQNGGTLELTLSSTANTDWGKL